MNDTVTPQHLLEGGAYALEQCGLLLRDANILYRSGSYATAVVLTAFAREELGRARILFDFWRRASAGGETFKLSDIRTACEDHVAKQRAGMLSSTIMTDQDTGLGKLLRTRMEHHPQSPEWQKANDELERITKIQQRRTPTDRHEQRISALYVEPVSLTDWNRPAATPAYEAHRVLRDAVNDYAGQYQQQYITGEEHMLKHVDPDLYSALAQWSARPVLPPPEWPAFQSLSAAVEKPDDPVAAATAPTVSRGRHMRQFFLGLLVGIIIGAVGAVIYAEWAVSGLDEELLGGAPAGQR